MISGFGSNIKKTIISPNMALVLKLHSFSTSCFEVLSDQFPVYDFQCSLIFWVSKLASAVPPMPFWNMDDKGGWPLWLLRNTKWNLLVNWSSGCKYFSACQRADGWSPKSRKGWRWSFSVLQLILFLPSGSYEGINIFCSRNTNSLTVNYKHSLSLKYLLWTWLLLLIKPSKQ